MVIQITEKMIIVSGSVTCGKTLFLKKRAEYLRKQGKKLKNGGMVMRND